MNIAYHIGGENTVVYCTKCGTKNHDDANTCSNCGEPLQWPTSTEGSETRRPRSAQRSSDVCFWDEEGPEIPRFIVYLIGAAFLVAGIVLAADVWFNIRVEFVGPAIILLVGLGIIWYGLTRARD